MSTSSRAGAARAGARAGADVGSRTTRISRPRLVLVDLLIAITTLLAVVGMLSVYANRLLFNPDSWQAQSTKLLANPTIRSETAKYLVDQLYANVNLTSLIESAVPSQLAPLAGSAGGALRGQITQGVEALLSEPQVQTLWARANRAADQSFIAVVNGDQGPVEINEGVVTLDLASVLDAVATRLGLPQGIATKLPPTIGTLTVLDSGQIKAVQDIGKLIKGLALWLTILVALLYLLAVLLARNHRRRTLITIGFAIVIAGLAGIGIRALLESQVSAALTSDAGQQSAIRAAVTIATELLGKIADAYLLAGAVLVVAASLAGLAAPRARTARTGRTGRTTGRTGSLRN